MCTGLGYTAIAAAARSYPRPLICTIRCRANLAHMRQTVNARFWPWLSGQCLCHILNSSLFARRLRASGTPPSSAAGKPETRKTIAETRNPKPQIRNPKPQTRNPKPRTRNPKPETHNLQPETQKPNPWALNLSYTINLLISFRKSTHPKDLQLIACYY